MTVLTSCLLTLKKASWGGRKFVYKRDIGVSEWNSETKMKNRNQWLNWTLGLDFFSLKLHHMFVCNLSVGSKASSHYHLHVHNVQFKSRNSFWQLFSPFCDHIYYTHININQVSAPELKFNKTERAVVTSVLCWLEILSLLLREESGMGVIKNMILRATCGRRNK
jgi:hypothetical protein